MRIQAARLKTSPDTNPTTLTSFTSRSPRGRSGERPPHFTYCFVRVTEMAPGHLWPGAIPSCCSTSTSRAETRFVPARRISNLWDCKVTPAYCACQERNTIGCISSNDGLDAGVADWFSTSGIHGGFTKQWPVVSGSWPVRPALAWIPVQFSGGGS